MRPYNHDIYLNGYKAVTFEGPLRLGTYDSCRSPQGERG